MLSDQELGDTAKQLANFKLAQQKHHTELSSVLERYTALLEDYGRLKSDFEEERDARERYKQIARGKERNPFALVLVDADEYVFDDDLISNGAKGGTRAAELLLDAVQRSLEQKQLEDCRVVVRCYASLSDLSRKLSQLDLCGTEKGSLDPFVAGFNRSADVVDFVDTGELKEKSESKLSAAFRLYAENAQCKHIYFAACHDVSYIRVLTSITGSRDRITLIRGPALDAEFTQLNLPLEDFPDLFRPTTLDAAYQMNKAKVTETGSIASAGRSDLSMSMDIASGQVCYFFQRGSCKYGNTCRMLHIKMNGNSTQRPMTPANLKEVGSWRQDTRRSNGSVSPSNTLRLENKDRNWGPSQADSTVSQVRPMHSQAYLSSVLPRARAIPDGHVAVNNDQHRLDPFVQTPSKKDMTAFYAITSKRKLCHNYHVRGECAHRESCTFDHSPIRPEILQALRSWTREMACPRRGECRSTTCLKGHICQKLDCKHHGGRTECKLPPTAHQQDLSVVTFVVGDPPRSKDNRTRTSSPAEEQEDLISMHPDSEQLTTSNVDDTDLPAVNNSEDYVIQKVYDEW